MAFIDELQVHIKAGDGGDGAVRFLTSRIKPRGGPAGGNGGKGGDVYIRGSRDTNLLFKYRFTKEFNAENGVPGGGNSMHGKNGEDLHIDIPIGSIVKNLSTGEEYEVLSEGEDILILKGGQGGLGNEHFKSSTNQAPKKATEGKPGEEAEFYIEIRLVADVGLIGLPSAGKSSLLNSLTKSDVKVGDYPFTTLDPNLGVLYGIILADIPGVIEGASEGKGLGHKFLRHISRVNLLLHCISVENMDIKETYQTIRKELENFDPKLAEKEEVILITKTDLASKETIEEIKGQFPDKTVLDVSILDEESLKNLSDFLTKKINK